MTYWPGCFLSESSAGSTVISMWLTIWCMSWKFVSIEEPAQRTSLFSSYSTFISRFSNQKTPCFDQVSTRDQPRAGWVKQEMSRHTSKQMRQSMDDMSDLTLRYVRYEVGPTADWRAATKHSTILRISSLCFCQQLRIWCLDQLDKDRRLNGRTVKLLHRPIHFQYSKRCVCVCARSLVFTKRYHTIFACFVVI